MENIDFRTFVTVTSQQWSLLKENCDFELLWTFVTRSIGYFVQKGFVFQENAQSLQK